MFEVELSFTIDIPTDIITFTFYFPVIATVSVTVVAESRNFLAAADWGLKVRVGV